MPDRDTSYSYRAAGVSLKADWVRPAAGPLGILRALSPVYQD
jgi:hypothetical protein